MKTAKEILESIKAIFNQPIIAADAPPPPAPPAPVVVPKSYKLENGTEIQVTQAGDTIAVGDTVSIAGAPAPAGEHTLEDKSILVVDATGKITEIKPSAPVTTDLNNQPPAPPVQQPVQMSIEELKTPDDMRKLYAKFAEGTPEDRIANLELVAKALMEYSFGWQIREAEQKATAEQAINIYKSDLQKAQAALEKHEQTIKGLFELCEKLTELPAADPKTLNGHKKDQFEKANTNEQRFERIAASLRQIKEDAKTIPA